MDSFKRLKQRLACMRGLHHGGNFCIYCGAQIAADPFLSFRVLSNDGRLDIVVKARNEHHAKRQLQEQYPPSALTAQQIADN